MEKYMAIAYQHKKLCHEIKFEKEGNVCVQMPCMFSLAL